MARVPRVRCDLWLTSHAECAARTRCVRARSMWYKFARPQKLDSHDSGGRFCDWSAYRITSRSQWSKCGVTLAVHDLPSTLSPRPERSTSDWIWNLCEAFRSIGRHAGDWVWVCVVLDWDRGHTRGEKGDMKTKYRRHEVFFGFTLGHWTFNTNISN